jgi:23S rRNA (cytosine1962-C5)-methyltransferase
VRILHEAAQSRRPLWDRTDALRLHDADQDAVSGLTVELYGDFAVLEAYERQVHEEREHWAAALLELGVHGVYYKQRLRADLRKQSQSQLAPSEPIAGRHQPQALEVHEGELRFLIRLGDGLSTGLFLDQRDNRAYLAAHCRGARVLNLFSYTCSFSVAAGVGGAREVTSVDLSRSFLQRGDANLRLNQLDASCHRLLKADARKWLSRAVRREERYDWIILDPPSFASVGGSAFSVQGDYSNMATDCLRLLSSGGRLLAVLNHRGTRREELRRSVVDAAHAAGRRIDALEELGGPIDCVSRGPAATKCVRLTAG